MVGAQNMKIKEVEKSYHNYKYNTIRSGFTGVNYK